jgi:hypothetical protein
VFDTAFVLLVIAALLGVVGFCQPLGAYLKLPPPVLLGVVGVALGALPHELDLGVGAPRSSALVRSATSIAAPRSGRP